MPLPAGSTTTMPLSTAARIASRTDPMLSIGPYVGPRPSTSTTAWSSMSMTSPRPSCCAAVRTAAAGL